jgi:putative ABC transport system permease protein
VPTTVAPMIRARILSINGKAFERSLDPTQTATREQEQESRLRNRGVNLSYRDSLSASESLVQGQWFSGPFVAAPETLPGLSVEQHYAERVGLRLGDLVQFDVQGVQLSAKVTSLRTVSWNSFQPNFFILLQPGVLDLAPKIWLITLGPMPTEKSKDLQNQLLQKFPNVSLLDVHKIVESLTDLTLKITWILLLMAVFSLLSGWVVVFAIVLQRAGQRLRDLNLLRVLGASDRSIVRILSMEFALLSSLAAALGTLLSALFAALLNWFLFEQFYPLSVGLLAASGGVVAVSSLLVSGVSARSSLRRNPSELLHSAFAYL